MCQDIILDWLRLFPNEWFDAKRIMTEIPTLSKTRVNHAFLRLRFWNSVLYESRIESRGFNGSGRMVVYHKYKGEIDGL